MAQAVSGLLFSNCLSFYLKMWVVQAEFALHIKLKCQSLVTTIHRYYCDFYLVMGTNIDLKAISSKVQR